MYDKDGLHRKCYQKSFLSYVTAAQFERSSDSWPWRLTSQILRLTPEYYRLFARRLASVYMLVLLSVCLESRKNCSYHTPYTHTRTHTRAHTHTHTPYTHARTHTHTHTHTPYTHTHPIHTHTPYTHTHHTHTHTHTIHTHHTHTPHTHTHAHTHVCFCEKWGHPKVKVSLLVPEGKFVVQTRSSAVHN